MINPFSRRGKISIEHSDIGGVVDLQCRVTVLHCPKTEIDDFAYGELSSKSAESSIALRASRESRI